MFCYLFLAVSAIGSGCLIALTPLAWWWIFPIFVGLFVTLNVLYLGVLFVSSLFLPARNKPLEHPLSWTPAIIWFSTDWLMKLLRVNVRWNGAEQLPQEPFVLVSNHVSNFDPIAVLCTLKKRKIAFISKEENFRIPIVGAYIHSAGFFAIDRENAMSAMRTIKRASAMMQQEQMILGIYPEGTRSKTGELLEFKEGAFLLAKRSNAPVVVISTTGTERIGKQMFRKTTHVKLNVLEVIDRDTIHAESLSELALHVRTTIANDLGKQ